MGKKPILKLRVYRGREVNYDANGSIKNENHLVSLEHNSRNWVIFMKNLPLNGYCKVTVEEGFMPTKDGYDDITDLSNYEVEVQGALLLKNEKELTPDQKEIAILKAQVAELVGSKKSKKQKSPKEETPKSKENKVDERSLRDIYIEEVGKKPYGGWSEDKVREKLEEHRAKQ